jgi:hypothetical protein
MDPCAFVLYLMTMLLENSVFDTLFLLEGKMIGVDHGVEGQVADVLEGVGRHVEADGSVEEHAAELEERMEREGCHVRF